MAEDFYTPEQLVAMIRFTDHSKCRGKSVYAETSNLLNAVRRACDQYQALHGDDGLGEEYTRSLKRRAFSRGFIERIFPYIAGVKNSKGLPMKFVDYEHSAPAPATEISTVPPIDPAYTAQREMDKELAEIYLVIDSLDLNSDPFPVDLGEAARWLGYSGKPSDQKRNAKAALLKLDYKAGSDYRLVKIHEPVPQGGYSTSEEIRLTAECFKKLCLRAGTGRADRVREYFIAAEQRFRAAFKGESLQTTTDPRAFENVIRRVFRDETKQQLTAAAVESKERDAKTLAAIEAMQQQLEELKNTINKGQTPAVADLKRLHGSLYQQVLEQHYHFKDGIHCPCCNKATTTWEVDHWRSKADSSRSNGWKICRPCNQALGAAGDSTKRDMHKNKFDAFQLMCDNYEQAMNERDGTQLGLSIS